LFDSQTRRSISLHLWLLVSAAFTLAPLGSREELGELLGLRFGIHWPDIDEDLERGRAFFVAHHRAV